MWADGGSYDAWVRFLTRWGAGERLDGDDLPALAVEDFAPDHWERLSDHVLDAVGRRLATWAAALTAAIGQVGDEFGVARALTQARIGLRSIRAVAGHPGLPADLRPKFLETVDTTVRSAQAMLEQQVDAMRRQPGVTRSDVEARLRTIRDNPLTVVTGDADPMTVVRGPDAWAGAADRPRRRVIT